MYTVGGPPTPLSSSAIWRRPWPSRLTGSPATIVASRLVYIVDPLLSDGAVAGYARATDPPSCPLPPPSAPVHSRFYFSSGCHPPLDRLTFTNIHIDARTDRRVLALFAQLVAGPLADLERHRDAHLPLPHYSRPTTSRSACTAASLAECFASRTLLTRSTS